MFKNLILLSGFSTFVVFAIIALNIYHTRTTSTIQPVTQKYSTPINPSFDTQTLNELKNRVSIPVDLNGASGVITSDEKEATQGAAIFTPTPAKPSPAPTKTSTSAIPASSASASTIPAQ